jgi:ribosome-associated protein
MLLEVDLLLADNAGVTGDPIPIRGDTIRLGQLLKLADVTGSGAEVKALLTAGGVTVNGEPESRRGRQLHPGDVVRAAGRELLVTGS